VLEPTRFAAINKPADTKFDFFECHDASMNDEVGIVPQRANQARGCGSFPAYTRFLTFPHLWYACLGSVGASQRRLTIGIPLPSATKKL
jgi:hypothetical protein